jgi:hypothetical protein
LLAAGLNGGDTFIFARLPQGQKCTESLPAYHEKTVVLIETTVFSAKSTLAGGINHLR